MFWIWIFALALLSNGVHAKWDLAVGVSHYVELLSANEVGDTVEQIPLLQEQIYALGYDSIRNQLYFSDLNQKNYSIYRLNLSGHDKRPQPIINKQEGVVRGLAVDPISSTLYWTSSNSIRWLKVSEDLKEPQDGSDLFNFDKQLPQGIAVDVCNRLLYWTNKYDMHPTIERSQLDGNNRKVFVSNVDRPIGIFIDQSSKRIFWSDEQSSGTSHQIESTDFDGNNRMIHAELDHLPLSMVVVGKQIFWLDSSSSKALKSLSIVPDKNKSNNRVDPKVVKHFVNKPYGIITAQQDSNLSSEECSVLTEKKKQIEEERKNRTAGHPLEHVDNSELLAKYGFCLNYGTVTDKGECLCPLGFMGLRCEISMCHNYCIEGECRIIGGAPRCQCPPGRSGLRCQEDRCDGYCFHGGECSIDPKDDELRCECLAQFSGERCQRKLPDIGSNKLCVIYCHMQELSDEYRELLAETDHFTHLITRQPDLCSCPIRTEKSLLENCTGSSLVVEEMNTNPNRVCNTENTSSSTNMNDVLYTLCALCLFMLVVIAVLVSKVWTLRKRPKIKKRIIVNKSVTPLTCRPQSASEQCEITIENCCNMNICETPCFEPDFRKPSAKENSSSKKEEKRNLLGGIELPPDDLY